MDLEEFKGKHHAGRVPQLTHSQGTWHPGHLYKGSGASTYMSFMLTDSHLKGMKE